jgi:hypothetical protein
MISALHRTWKNSRILLMAAVLILGQLGIATHSHAASAKQDGQNVELNCAFCIAGTHLQSGPTAPTFHVPHFASVVFAVEVRHVCDIRTLISPRLTRGPPRSTTCF